VDPQHVAVDDIKKYLVELGKTSLSQQKQSLAALKLFYTTVVKQKRKLSAIRFPKWESKLPDIIGREDLLRRIGSVKDVRYRAIFGLLYETGLRVSECASLKTSAFNRERKEIRVRDGKGGKDRIVTYGDGLRELLKPYFITRKESQWLFHGENTNNYISPSTIEKNCRELIDMHPHQLRHCFAVHYLEGGGDIYILSKLLGHNKIQTTERYLRLTVAMLSRVPNHLDTMRKSAA
jgi:site-specific recombinase XerD